MFIRTAVPHGTMSLHKQRTSPPIRIQTKPILLPQELVKCEPAAKLLGLGIKDILGKRSVRGCCRRRRRCGHGRSDEWPGRGNGNVRFGFGAGKVMRA